MGEIFRCFCICGTFMRRYVRARIAVPDQLTHHTSVRIPGAMAFQVLFLPLFPSISPPVWADFVVHAAALCCGCLPIQGLCKRKLYGYLMMAAARKSLFCQCFSGYEKLQELYDAIFRQGKTATNKKYRTLPGRMKRIHLCFIQKNGLPYCENCAKILGRQD